MNQKLQYFQDQILLFAKTVDLRLVLLLIVAITKFDHVELIKHSLVNLAKDKGGLYLFFIVLLFWVWTCNFPKYIEPSPTTRTMSSNQDSYCELNWNGNILSNVVEMN